MTAPTACADLQYPPGGPFSLGAIRALTDERLLELLDPRTQLGWTHRRRVECEAFRRGLIQHLEVVT